MKQASPYVRETIIEPHEVCSTFTQMTGVELLPVLKHQFGKSLQDSLYTVRLMETAELLIVRSDGIPHEFDASRAHAETPLRSVLIQLQGVLPDDAFHELQNLAHHSCPLTHPKTYQYSREMAAQMILHFLESVRLAEATDIFYPEFLSLLRKYEEEIASGERHVELAEAKNNATFLILEWAKNLAKPAAILIQERMVTSIIASLKSASPFGVHGDEFDSAWDEYTYALNAGSDLSNIIDEYLEQATWDAFVSLPHDDKRSLWLNVRGIESEFKFRLDEGYEMEPDDEIFRQEEVIYSVLKAVHRALITHVEETSSNEII
jgi:hypothetical protein